MKLRKSSATQGHSSAVVGVALLVGGLAACSNSVQGSGRQRDTGNAANFTNSGGSGSMLGNGTGANGSTSPSSGGGNGVVVSLPAAGALGPIAIRRLNTAEYENTVQKLLTVGAGTAATFLPDDQSSGFQNMAAALRVPQAVAEQYQRAAKSLAAGVATNATTVAPCADPAGEAACAEAYIRKFGEQAYRRPLSNEEVATYAKLFADERARATYAKGISIIVETMLQSPHFLYKTEFGTGAGVDRKLTPYELASQISYLATGSMPDEQLFAAAAADSLSTAAGREAQIRRLLPTAPATPWLRGFVLEWLGITKSVVATKDAVLFPTYDTGLQASIVEESHRFVDAIFNEGNGSVVSLFNADWSYADGTLASHYGVTGPTGAAWQKVAFTGERLGILTQAAFLTAHSKTNDSFPITRGKILRTRVMCTAMPPPPDNIKIDPVPVSTTLTTRERFAAHSANPVCATCHTLIDPLGFGFENYDAVGTYRAMENGKTIDSSGEVRGIDPEVDGPFANGVEFARRIATSKVLKNCVSREAFRWGIGRVSLDPVTDTASPDYPKYLRDKSIIDAMEAKMASSNADMRELLTGLVSSDSYPFRSDQ